MSRLSSMSRFAEPTAADDRADCQGCDRSFHYEELDDDGNCPDCRKEHEREEEPYNC